MRTLLFILAAFFCGYASVAQLSRTSLHSAKGIYTIKGDYYRDHRNYVFAINNYSKATKQNPKDVAAMLGMAAAYHKLGKDDLAIQWYRKALAIDPDVGPAHLLQYISILSTEGNSAELRRWAIIYTDRIVKSGQHTDSAMFVADNLKSLNSKASDSGPLLYDGKLMFSSDRTLSGNFNSYKSPMDADGNFGEVNSFHGAINSGRSEGAIAIAANSATLFFTAAEPGSTSTPPLMEIFSSAIPAAASDPVKVSQLRFKKFDHSMGHPAVNSDGTVLYFAAHSPKHTRGFDLYRSEYDGKKWSAPVALGTSVNSHRDELYPVLSNDSTLYFASNGHGGLGGFDIFKVNLRHKHHPAAEHLPAPVNSTADDFGFVMNSVRTEAFVSSNRPGGLGGNDLYRIYILPLKTRDKAAPKHEELLIYTSKGDEIKLSGGSKENLKFDFQPGRKYNLVVEYDNFLKGTAQTISNAATLTRLNVYTFDIQKSSEAVYDRKNKSKPVQDIHINPGDLVTFQLIPNLAQDPEADDGKIQFQRSEVIVGDRESVIFSYVAEGGSSVPEADMSTVADLSKLDTLTSAQAVAAKEALAKPDKTAAVSSAAGTTKTSNEVAAVEPVKTQVADLNRPAPTEALTASTTSEKNVAEVNTATNATKQTEATPVTTAKVQPDLTPGNNPISEKSETKEPTPLQPTAPLALQEQPTDGQNKTAAPLTTSNKGVKAQQQTPAETTLAQGSDKGSDSTRTKDVVVAAKESEKGPPSADNVNDLVLTQQPGVEKNVDAKQTSTTKPIDDTAVTTVKAQTDLPVTDPTVSEKSETKALSTLQPASSLTSQAQEQRSGEQNKNADALATTDKGVKAQQQTPAETGDKGSDSIRTQDVVVAAKESEKGSPPANNVNNTALTQQPGAEKNADAKQTNASKPTDDTAITTVKAQTELPANETPVSEKSETKALSTPQPVSPLTLQEQRSGEQNKTADALAVTDKAVDAEQQTQGETAPAKDGDAVSTPDVVVAAKEDKKDPAAEKNVNDITLKEQSNIVEKNVDANKVTADVTKAAPKNNVVSTEVATTPASPDQNNASQVPPPPGLADKKSVGNTIESGDIRYRVQIAASRSKLSEALLEKIYPGPREIRSFTEEGYYKYYIEQTPHYPSATRALNESGVGKAFIAAYQGDTKLNLHDAIAMQKKNASTQGTSSGPKNTDAATEPLTVISAQPDNSTKTLSEDPVVVTTDVGNEKQVLAVTPKLQDEPEISGKEENAPDTSAKKDIPVSAAKSNETMPTIVPATGTLIAKDDPVALANAVDTNEPVKRDDFQYRLQIAASKGVMSNARLKKIYPRVNEIRVFEEEGFHKYYILETSNYFVAHQTLKKIDAEHAFISAYKKDVKLPLLDAITSQYKVPVIKSELAEWDSLVKITTVNFELDEFELQSDQVEHLRSTVIGELKNNPSFHVIVNGYTDIRGSEAYNFGLSQERALFVEQRIVAEGIDAGRVTAQYFGESQLVKYCPEHENCDESIHQANRRVEILLLVNKK